MGEKYTRLKTATASIIRRREDVAARVAQANKDLAQTDAELGVALETSQDDLALVLIQKKNQLTAELAEMKTELDTAQTDADGAKNSLLGVQSEIRKLKAERDSMLAKMQSAQARLRIQQQLDGLSVEADVKALENVREHIKTTIAMIRIEFPTTCTTNAEKKLESVVTSPSSLVSIASIRSSVHQKRLGLTRLIDAA